MKRPNRALDISRAFLLCILLFSSACYRAKEGCQDLAATNLDVTADKPCDGCCTYPKLRLSMRQVYDTLTFVENNIYPNSLGQYFRLKSVAFYLSDFEVQQGTDALTVSDTLTFSLYGASISDTTRKTLTNDFVLVRRGSENIEIGSFRSSGTFDGLRCKLGLSPAEQPIISRSTPANHPLQRQQDSLWHGYTQGYVFMQVVVATDTASASTTFDTLSLTRADFSGDALPLGTPVGYSVTHRSGFDFTIRAIADYKVLLQGIDWVADNKSQIKSKLVANLPDVFVFF